MKLETAIEMPRAVLAKSITYRQIKMVQEHVNFPLAVNGLGCKISTDKG